MSQSIPFQISAAMLSALQSAPAFDGARLLDNPTSAAALMDGDRVLFVEDQHDELNKQPNATEQRTFTLTVGVINRSAEARAAADADMEAVKQALRSITAQLVGIGSLRLPREGRRTYKLEGIDVGGALIVTEFLIDYLNPRPPRAG
jgi:hypothetical protein